MPDNSENRYHADEVIEKDRITCLKIDGNPVNGVVYEKFDNGQLSKEENYKDGKSDELYRAWYSNGQLREEVNHKDWEHHGLVRQWHKNGQLSWEGNFKDGWEHGLQRGWYDNGQLSWEGNFKDGILLSSKSGDEEGNLTKDETY